MFTNYEELLDQIPRDFESYWRNEAFGVICGWFALNVVLERTLFARKFKGLKLRDGTQLTYNISGHLQFWVILFCIVIGKPVFHENGNVAYLTHYDLGYVYDEFIPLCTGAIVFSFVLSVYLFAKSFKSGAMLAEGGNTSSHVYNFFIGRELNPRTGSFDWKEFCELRPGLIGWVVLNLGCAMKQYSLLGYVSYSMLFVNVFQAGYVWDALYHESSILSTMDITTDGFGWMLCFGDLTWVPFSYSLQARYLVENDPGLSPLTLAFIFVLQVTGYW